MLGLSKGCARASEDCIIALSIQQHWVLAYPLCLITVSMQP